MGRAPSQGPAVQACTAGGAVCGSLSTAEGSKGKTAASVGGLGSVSFIFTLTLKTIFSRLCFHEHQNILRIVMKIACG